MTPYIFLNIIEVCLRLVAPCAWLLMGMEQHSVTCASRPQLSQSSAVSQNTVSYVGASFLISFAGVHFQIAIGDVECSYFPFCCLYRRFCTPLHRHRSPAALACHLQNPYFQKFYVG
jgi:hypothetical protein